MKLRSSKFVPFLALLLAGFGAAQTPKPVETFWKELEKLCGKAYAGTVVADTTGDERFKNKAMVMHVRSCKKDQVRIPFMVGDDRSRTWVITRKGIGSTFGMITGTKMENRTLRRCMAAGRPATDCRRGRSFPPTNRPLRSSPRPHRMFGGSSCCRATNFPTICGEWAPIGFSVSNSISRQR